MRFRSLSIYAAAGLLAVGSSVSAPPASADHCGSVFMFSGHDTGLGAKGPTSNAGAGGCVLDDEEFDTNYLQPGANFVTVASLATPVNGKGTLIVDGVETVLNFTYTTRWNSQAVSIPQGKDVTAVVTSASTGVTVSVTYHAAV